MLRNGSIRQGYSMKEKKDIIDFIVSKNSYDRVKGREFWVEYENSGKTTRTWQSVKEVFIKRILPDITNPYYKLSVAQVKCFRSGSCQKLHTVDWICKDNTKKVNTNDKNIQIAFDEKCDKPSEPEIIPSESDQLDSQIRISLDSALVACSDNMNQLINVIGRNEPNDNNILLAESITSEDKNGDDRSSSGAKDENLPIIIADDLNSRNQNSTIAHADVQYMLTESILLKSSSDSENEKKMCNIKNLSSMLGFSNGKNFVSKSISKNTSSTPKRVKSKTCENRNTSHTSHQNKLKSRRSHRILSSTESSSDSETNDDESSSSPDTSENSKSNLQKSYKTANRLVKTSKPIYAFYKGELFPLYVANSTPKYRRPSSTRSWHPTSHHFKKFNRTHKSQTHDESDSDESLSFYEAPVRKRKRPTSNGRKRNSLLRLKKIQSYNSSNESRPHTNKKPPLSPEFLPNTRIKEKIQNAAQSKADLDFPNDEIEMRYYKDLERYCNSGQTGPKPVKECYQRVLTEEEKRKHKKYSYIYKTDTKIKNVTKTEDSQSFWKIKYLMEKKNLNDVCKYMAQHTPPAINSDDHTSLVNTLKSLNDKHAVNVNVDEKNVNTMDTGEKMNGVTVDGKIIADKSSKYLCSKKEESFIPKDTSPKNASKNSKCLIKYSKNGEEIVNNTFAIDTQKESIFFSFLKKINETKKSPDSANPPKKNIIAIEESNTEIISASKATGPKEKISTIQLKENKIFNQIELQGEIINSSESSRRNIFTSSELKLLNVNSKSNEPEDSKKVAITENSENKIVEYCLIKKNDTINKNKQNTANASDNRKSDDLIKLQNTADGNLKENAKINIRNSNVITNKNTSIDGGPSTRRSPRIKTLVEAGPSHSTSKLVTEKENKSNTEKSILHTEKADESSLINMNGETDSKNDDNFFMNTKFKLNPNYFNISNQKTEEPESASSSSDLETTYKIPNTSHNKWKVLFRKKKKENSTSKTLLKRKSNGELKSAKRIRSPSIHNAVDTMSKAESGISSDLPMKNSELTKDISFFENSTMEKPFIFNVKDSFTDPPIFESQEIPLQDNLFDFLKNFPITNTTNPDPETINFKLYAHEKTAEAVNVNNETVVNLSLPLLEQDLNFPTKSAEVKSVQITEKNSVKFNTKDSETVCKLYCSGKKAQPSDENSYEDPNDTTPIYENNDRLCITRELNIHDGLDENIDPLHDHLFDTTASLQSFCSADSIFNILSNEEGKREDQETNLQLDCKKYQTDKLANNFKTSFNITSENINDLMTEEDVSQ